jgi:hypothetical protein
MVWMGEMDGAGKRERERERVSQWKTLKARKFK